MQVRFCNFLIHGGLIFLIVFTPIAFGTVEPWSVTVFQLVVLLMLIAWLVKMLVTARPSLVGTPLNIPALLFIIFIVFQMFPLPPGLLRTSSPNTYGLYKATLAQYDAPAGAESDPLTLGLTAESPMRGRYARWRSLSVYPHGTSGDLLRWGVYFVLFLVVVNTVSSRERINRIVYILVAFGVALAVFGIIQHFTWNGKIFWFRELRYGGTPFGPYVNRNHFAGYMEMIVPLSIGLVYSITYGAPSLSRNLRGFITWLGDPRISRAILLLFGVGIMVGAVFLSLSRGGAVSLFFSLVFFSMAISMRRDGQERGKRVARGILVPVFLLSLTFVVWMGLGRIWERLMTLSKLEYADVDRAVMWRDTIGIFQDFPLLGVGMGNFEHIYPKYRSLVTQDLLIYAHNDYLQFLAEGGIVGFVLFWCMVILVLAKTLARLRDRRDPAVRGIVAGGAAGILAIMVHSFVDFNLHIPANAAAFFLLLGLCYSAVHLPRRAGKQAASPAASETPVGSRLKAYAVTVLAIALAVIAALHVINLYRAERSYAAARRLETISAEDRIKQVVQLEKATSIMPSNARYRSELASSYTRLALAGEVAPAERRRLLESAVEESKKAVWLMPSNASQHVSLGWAAFLVGGDVGGAEKEFERALLLAPRDDQIKDFVRRWQEFSRPEP